MTAPAVLPVTCFTCGTERRRAAVRAAVDGSGRPLLNGIDYVEVDPRDQRRIQVVCLHPIERPAPSALIEGGVRIIGVKVTAVTAAGRILTVVADSPGDFSRYTLRLVASPKDAGPPGGFDPQLVSVSFSFKVSCPSDFDCQAAPQPPAAPPTEPAINYLAKDYATFRQLMLDRLSLLMPAWTDRAAADQQVMLVELLAYVADYLSYYQDAVATEAYLATARRRVSVRRHARLLDYFMHEGSNARAFVTLGVADQSAADGAVLPRGTALLTAGPTARTVVSPDEAGVVLAREQPVVFETMHDLRLRAAHTAIAFYTWSNENCRLPAGATSATLTDAVDASARRVLDLAKGDLLLLEAIVPGVRLSHVVRLTEADATRTDPLTGTPVVDVRWEAADALPFDLPVSSGVEPLAVARGNVVLADHGSSVATVPLEPPAPEDGAPYAPRVPSGPLTYAVPFDAAAAARTAMTTDVHDARPVIRLSGDGRSWDVRYDLLASDAFAAHFVVETEADGEARLRFGDGVMGLRPRPGASFAAAFRVGNGPDGNVGAGALTRVVWAGSGIVSVRNPQRASGGRVAETLEEVRQFAPGAFRRQERAVTEADYAAAAQRHPDVQKAAATIRWTGSWQTVFVTVDRKDGRPVDQAFKDELGVELDRLRMAGQDVEVEGPTQVPIDLALGVCVAPGYFQSQVKAQLLDALGSGSQASGAPGFFHPDRFTFGQPLYLSQIYQVAAGVAGVASVNVLRFQRLGKAANGEIGQGVLRVGRLEIVQLANDPNFPENGRLDVEMTGGL